MIKKKQAGQAFVLVLILLAIGALIVVPALRLTGTALTSSQAPTRQVKLLYALDGAQEYVLWALKYASYGAQFDENGESRSDLHLDACGTPVDITVIMRAVPGRGGITLCTDDLMKPTKTVTASNPVSTNPLKVANTSYQIFTYIIRMEQLSSNTTQGLDAVYDILPFDFGTGRYVPSSSYIRVDGGAWQPIADPSGLASGQDRLRWPASGSFASPIRDFNVRQVKELKFQIALTLPAQTKNTVQVNWVVLAMGALRTVSGPQAPIIIGTPADPDVYDTNGTPSVYKTSEPSIIPPGVEMDIKYTVTINNQDGATLQIPTITDYLPAGFYYTTNTTSGLTTANPTQTIQNINGVNRQVLVWDFSPQLAIAAGTSQTLIFWTLATKDVSGSYYNEVIVDTGFTVPSIFSAIGVTAADYKVGYSWNAGTVTVPTYDSSVEAGGVTVDSNMSLVVGGVTITSFHFR